MQVNAKNDVNVIGSSIKVGNEAHVQAGNDINVEAAMDESYEKVHRKTKGGLFKKSRRSTTIDKDQTAIASSISVGGGGAYFSAGNDINVVGSDLSSDGNLGLIAEGDVTIKGALEEDYHQVSTSKSGLFSSNSATDTTQKGNSRASSVKSNGILQVKSGNDITVMGSELVAKTDAVIDAGNDLMISSEEGYYKNDYTSRSRGLFNNGNKSTTTDDPTVYKTRIKVGNKEYEVGDGDLAKKELGGDTEFESPTGRLTIRAKNNAYIEGLNAESEGDMIIKAKNLYIAATEDERKEQSEKSKSGFANLRKEVDIKRGYTKTNHQTELKVGGSLFTETENDTSIEGGIFDIKKDLNMYAAGSLVMGTTEEVETDYKYNKVEEFGGISTSKTRSSMSLNIHNHVTTNESEETKKTHTGTKMRIGGNLTTYSKDDTVMIGSDIIAAGDIYQESENGSIIAMTAEEFESAKSRHEKAEHVTSFTLSNSWVEAGHQLQDAAEGFESASGQDLNSKNGKINAAAKTATSILETAQAARTVESVANAAKDASKFGFKGSVTQKVSKTTTSSDSESNMHKGSMIRSLSGSITQKAKKDILISGSQLIADEGDIIQIADRVRFKGVDDTYIDSSSLKHDEVSHTMSDTGPDLLPNYANQKQKDTRTENRVQKSGVMAGGTWKVKSRELTLDGAVGVAKDVDLTEVEELIQVKTMLGDITQKGEGDSLSVGNRMGFSINESEQNSQVLDQQSGIYATNSLKINTDKLELEGGVIAGLNEHKGDTIDLDIKVKQAEFKDIEVESHQYQERVGVGYQGISPQNYGGTITAEAANGGHHKKQTAHATIGQGNFQVGESTGIVNRDVANSVTIIKDERLGGLDADVTVDTRWVAGGQKKVIDKNGQERTERTSAMDEIMNDLGTIGGMVYTEESGVGGNAKRATNRAGNSAGDVLDAGRSMITKGLNPIVDLSKLN